MGFDAEIDNSERNSVVENLKDEVQCSICCSIFEVLKGGENARVSVPQSWHSRVRLFLTGHLNYPRNQ